LGISKFVKTNRDGQKVDKSLKLLGKAKGNEEKRKIESSLLKPDDLPSFTGDKAHGNLLRDKTIGVFFSKNSDMKLFCKHIKVSLLPPEKKSTYKIDKLIALLKYLDTGKIIYNEETNKIEEKTAPVKRKRRDRS
jgi:hypothetical protein